MTTDEFGQVNVIGGTVPTPIVAEQGNRNILQLYNAGAATVYMGGAAVTPANGFPVDVGDKMLIHGPSAIYGIVDSGTVDVRYYYSA